MSGYSLGRGSARSRARRSRDDDAFQPFWDTYHAIDDRYAGGDVDRDALVQGAIQGMIECARRPVLRVPDAPRSTARTCRASTASSRGSARRSRREAADGDRGLHAARARTAGSWSSRRSTGSPAEAAGLLAGDVVLAVDGVPLDGLTVDGARDKIRGPKGTTVTLTIQRGDGPPFDVADHPRHRPAAGGREQGPRRRDASATSASTGFSDTAADEVVDASSRRTSTPAGRS